MKNLLLDIGNSNIKIALSSSKKIINVKRCNYLKNNFTNTLKIIFKYKRNEFDSIGISCLNTNYRKIISNIIKNKYSVVPFFVKFDSNLPIKFKYEKSLGNDRICSAVAASIKYKSKRNILVIDFGTATTYNLVSNSIFIGGLITPGILTSLQSLNSKANLPMTNIKKISNLITNKTKTNILSGVIHQSLFTTEAIIKTLKKKYKNLLVISTGGLAELIYKKSCLIDKADENLVLEGINYILIHNKKSN
ncbi:MAG: type III pantothenate kinase [Ignavibacteriae bacterium]|nr:type III pantothenate kinase [Ignavibacteriota bacterium]